MNEERGEQMDYEAQFRQAMSRRRFLGLGAGLVATPMLLASCGGSEEEPAASGDGGESTKKVTLTLVTWGGTTQKGIEEAWAKPFGKQSGHTMKVIAPVDYGKWAAQIKAGKVTWNWVDAEAWFAHANADMLEPITADEVGVSADELITVNGEPAYQPWGVAAGSYSFAISYRTDHEGPHPTTWAEFFDTKAIPGKRSVYNWPYGMLEAALLADGVSGDSLYPLDIERAFKKLDSVRGDLVFWNSGAELQQQLSSGSVPFAYAWNNRVAYLAQRGTPVDVEWNENIQDGGYHVIAKGDPNKAQDLEFLRYILQPEPQAKFAELTGYSPSNKAALDMIPADKRKWYNATPENLDKAAAAIDTKWWGENMDAVTEKWAAWAGS
jgi:putative spermidine/putrescine transport system substrate-binding protein